MLSPQNKYIESHSTPLPEALEWVEKQTHIRTNYPQMLCGPQRGRLLKLLVEISGAENVLEIGTFTGYSTICLALGLPEGGHIDAVEINDELEDIIREGWERAGVAGKITLHIADARIFLAETPPDAGYDLIYMDANKREYSDYFDLVIGRLAPGGLLVVDDVLMGGKVYAEPAGRDAQTKGLLEFNEKASRYPGIETVMLPIGDGVSIIKKKR